MKFISIIPVALLLAACGEKEVTLLQLCQSNKQYCDDLWDDSHCKDERRSVIFSRVSEAKLPSDANKYQLLMDFERYHKCMELAAGIEHIKLKEKTTERVKNVMVAQKEIKRLSAETTGSDHPGLAFYHWSREHSEPHLQKFLKAANAGELKTPELMFAYGQYWMDRDLDKAIETMLKTLTLYKAEQKIDTDIYTSLTTLYYKKQDFAASYHWALVAKKAGVERIEFQRILQDLAPQVDKRKLEALAESTVLSLTEGQFKPPVY